MITSLLLAFIIFAGGFVSGILCVSVQDKSSQGILTGKSAERFLKQMKENENKKVSPEESERIKKELRNNEKYYCQHAVFFSFVSEFL